MYWMFLIIFLLSLIFIKLIQQNANALGLIDIPNGRTMHKKHTPSGAGIGFMSAVIVVVPFFYSDFIVDYIWTMLAIAGVFLIGILDDHHDTSPRTKFLVIILATVLVSFDHLMISTVGICFEKELTLGWFALPFTIFAVVGFTNGLNLIDGLDGLSGLISLIILSTFYFIGHQNNDMFIMILAGSTIAAVIAFLIYNWAPASIFMGDSGSLTLGFVIAVLGIKALEYMPPISLLFVTALPILDTIVVMIRRKVKGRTIFSADRCHMHHILRHFFAENTPRTVIFLGVWQAIYALTGLQLKKGMDEGYLFMILFLNIILLYFFLEAMIKRQNRDC